uniref:Uncharacterized protein n=1 Tax=Ditylenchus dipsaci TaxID=166011 RepID=A0A915ER47_9BILA
MFHVTAEHSHNNKRNGGLGFEVQINCEEETDWLLNYRQHQHVLTRCRWGKGHGSMLYFKRGNNVPFDLKECFHLFSMLSLLPVVDVLRGYQALLHRFRDLADRYENTEEEIEKINAFFEYFRKTFLYQSSLIPGGSFREARYKIKIWNFFDSLLTNHWPITNNDAEDSNMNDQN